MKRRKFIGAGILSGIGLTTSGTSVFKDLSVKRVLRIVHLTDMHIEPNEKIRKAIRALLEKIGNLEDRPDFILNTGDNIMDALYRDKENVNEQWQAWLEYFRNNLDVDMHSCIGNHDIWGWGLNNPKIEKDPLAGKTWAAAMLNLKERYYSFEIKGWKFILLDSSFRESKKYGYTAKLDKDQFDWLRKEIEDTPKETFICIASHIPVLSVCVFFDGDNLKDGNWELPGAWMHTDAKELKELFYQYPNVKAALSGHIHLADQVEYLDVKYMCNGAVCGKWWMGKYHEFGPAFAVVDFFDDGKVTSELIPYKW